MTNDPLELAVGERGVVRVFTTDLEPAGDAAITSENIHKLLGEGVQLDPKKVEVFPAHLIEALGLPSYLEEGYGIPASAMAGKVAVLEALSGLVILIPSSAILSDTVRLDPNPALRVIGAFQEEKAAPPERMSRTEESDGDVLGGGSGSGSPSKGNHVRSWIIALGALLAAAALVLLVLI